MQRTLLTLLFAILLAVLWIAAPDAPTVQANHHETSGHGDYKFKVLYRSDHLPSEAQSVLEKAHGGFAVDRRSGKGETYFALPGAGIIQISADLKKTKMVPTAPAMKDTNMHNATIWYGDGGKPFLTFPGNSAAKVFTTDLKGKLLHTLDTPAPGVPLGNPAADDYFAGRGNFVPTDTEYRDGLLYVATGYSALDYVLTAKVAGTSPFKAAWHDLAFGGKGDAPGQFGTGHGITVPPGTGRIDVADRPNAEIDRFTRYGHYVGTLALPNGSFPCDIDYLDDYALVGALHGANRGAGAPIFLYENDELVSTVMCKADLGLENFQHIHNAVLRKLNGKLYMIVQAWNPGDFAILEQITN